LTPLDVEAHGTKVDATGDRAIVTTNVALDFSIDQPSLGIHYWRATTPPWTFGLVKDDGWRVCQVEAPDLCATAVRCTPRPTPSPSPSEDLHGDVRDMLPCGPRDPFRSVRPPGECAMQSPGSSAPSATPS
jgi:hypothetical protein